MKDRGGRVVAFPVARTDKVELQSAVIENVEPGSNLFTDGNTSYQNLSGYAHDFVMHNTMAGIDRIIAGAEGRRLDYRSLTQ